MRLLEVKRIKGTLGTIHFVGVGGIGMSGIAELLHNLGYKVQGSDCKTSSITLRLEKMGIPIFYSHKAENVSNAEFVVVSSAIDVSNIEIIAAQKSNIPVIKRSEMLAELMKLKTSIAISGTHGKTTTTSLIGQIFEAAGLAPTVINGGILNSHNTNAYLGKGDYLIAEADESDATFVKIPSTIAVITNIEEEHMEFYGNKENLFATFKSFITNLPFYGFAVVCFDHKETKELALGVTERRVISYGIDDVDVNIRGVNIRLHADSSLYDVVINLPHYSQELIIKDIKLPVSGLHNVLNSLAAIAIAAELEFDTDVIQNAFKNFTGVKRRFTKIGEINGVLVIDDYGHHPSEIAVTLISARCLADARGGKVIAVFQPHRYSRLHYLFSEFVKCFDNTDMLYVAPVYCAGEKDNLGVSSAKLVEAIKSNSDKIIVDELQDLEKLPYILEGQANPSDIMIFFGAGDITKWANDLPDKFAAIKKAS